MSDELWTDPWCNAAVAEQQMAGVKDDMASWLGGNPHAAFDPFCAVLFQTDNVKTVLEAGCGCGQYAEVLLASGQVDDDVRYHGMDASAYAINLAREHFGASGTFYQSDAACIREDDESFDLVISGSLIGHVADWHAVVGELCRVSKRYVMLHRVQCHSPDDQLLTKRKTKTAYGVLMNERSFGEPELIKMVERSFGMRHIFSTTWSKTQRYWQLSCLFEKVM